MIKCTNGHNPADVSGVIEDNLLFFYCKACKKLWAIELNPIKPHVSGPRIGVGPVPLTPSPPSHDPHSALRNMARNKPGVIREIGLDDEVIKKLMLK